MNVTMNQNRPGNMTIAFLIMLLLYFIIGLFTVINQQLQIPLQAAMLPHDGNITNSLVTLLNFSWFMAYPVSEGFATRWLDKYGYRKTSVYALLILIAGLAVYEMAVLFHLYTPSTVAIMGNQISVGFFIFLAGSFIIGIAATVLQVIMNLYLDLFPVGSTTPLQRQMIGGTSNSIGMAIAPLVVSYLIFAGTPLHQIRTQQFILPIVVLIGCIALVTFVTDKSHLPDSSGIVRKKEEPLNRSIWSFPNLKYGLWGIFFYVGVEVAVGANINMYAVELGHTYASQASHLAAAYWGLLLVGRLAGSFIKTVSSQKQLVVAAIGAIALLILSVLFSNPWLLAGVGLFHSVMWPAIFTLAIDKLGIYSTKASGILMIGVLGGGIIPLLQGILADYMNGDWKWTWILVIAGEVYILFYGLKGYHTAAPYVQHTRRQSEEQA